MPARASSRAVKVSENYAYIPRTPIEGTTCIGHGYILAMCHITAMHSSHPAAFSISTQFAVLSLLILAFARRSCELSSNNTRLKPRLTHSITHAQDMHGDIPHSILDLLMTLPHLAHSLPAAQKRDAIDDRTAAVFVKCREDLPLLRPNHPMLPLALMAVAQALMLRFMTLSEVADIDECIAYLDEVLAIPPSWEDGSPDDELHNAALSLSFLGDALTLRFNHSKNVEDADAAIENYRIALTLYSSHEPIRRKCLEALVQAFKCRFGGYGRKEDVDEAIQWQREAVSLCQIEFNEGDTNESLAGFLNGLGDLLMLRYNTFNLILDVEEATESYETALAFLLDNSEIRPQYLGDLAISLYRTFKAKGQVEHLNGAIDRVREAIACLLGGNAPLDEILGSLAQNLNQLLGDLLVDRYRKVGLIVDLEEATESYGKALVLLPDNSEKRPLYLSNLSLSLHLTFRAKGQVEDLNGAIDRLREAVACLSDGNVPVDEDEMHGSLAQKLNQLGDLLRLRYRKVGLIVDLEEATESYGKALILLPDNSEKRPFYLRDLSSSLHRTFQAKGQVEDLNGAIDRLREAIAYLSDGNVPVDEDEIHGPLAQNLNQLGDLLVARYQNGGPIVDLEEATESYGKALVLLPDNSERRPRYLRDLALSLQRTYEAKGQVEDLKGAIDRIREALACLSGGNVSSDEGETCISLGYLGLFLEARFRWTRERPDIDEAIQCQYQAMVLDPTHRGFCLDNLSTHWYALYSMTEDHSDLEQALGFSREALELCSVDDNSSRLPVIKSHMAAHLDARFRCSGRAEDLEEALKIRRGLVARTEGKIGHRVDVGDLVQSLDLQRRRDPGQLSVCDEGIKQHRDSVLPILGPDHLDFLEQLAISILHRFQRSREPEDLEEAITYLRELTALIPRGPIRHANHLSHLAGALRSRFFVFGRIEDIDDAIDSAQEAVAIVRSQASHIRDHLIVCLSVLASCLDARCIYEEAIAIWREVVSLSPPNIWTALCNLASSILSRQLKLGEPDGIEEAIVLLRKSLTLIPAEHPDRLRSLDALALAAVMRCLLGGGIENQEDVLEICHENVAAYERFPLDKDCYFAIRTLAKAYWIKGDYDEAVTHFERAVNLRYATPHSRFQTATQWAGITMQAGHSSSLRAHMKALELLDRCLTSTPTIDLQHQFLTENASTLATNAASRAIESGELEIAVQALEQGRALLWSRMRGYRHPIEKLHGLNAGLAEEFKEVCQQLEHLNVSSQHNVLGMPPILVSTTPHTPLGLDFDAKVTNNRQLLDDYERIISEIRQIDGFSSFLQATPFSTLQTAASEGPVILVNINEHRSDAMILRATETPLLVPLPENLSAVVDKLATWLIVVDHINRNEERKGVARQPKHIDLSNILQILWNTVCQPIALALQEMGHPEGSRVWWCPIGRLGALPLHAAGIYDNKGVLIEGFPNLYVSSYTPTLSSLIASRETAVKGGSGPRLLAVGQSNSLPKVKDEFFKLKSLFPSNVLEIRDGDRAESDKVLDNLQNHPWVHFACHGSLDTGSPFKSGFVLHDKKLSLRDIMQARLPNAELAFLAACHSAASESTSKTPDEVLTLAAAMQFCGFRSIVGTLWTMSDNDGPVLAEKFYTHMLCNGLDNMDVRDSAEAVHLATKSMRESGVPLHRWTTFVHVGI